MVRCFLFNRLIQGFEVLPDVRRREIEIGVLFGSAFLVEVAEKVEFPGIPNFPQVVIVEKTSDAK
jgi:hypothetical protein